MRPGIQSTKASRTTFITERQATVHALFVRHQSMSFVARMMGVSPITIRETLVQYQRNALRDQGIRPPPLKAMLRGDVGSRFGVEIRTGRPAFHDQVDPLKWDAPQDAVAARGQPSRVLAAPSGGVRRMIVTSAEPGAHLHEGFWNNLSAYSDAIGAELLVLAADPSDRLHDAGKVAEHLLSAPLRLDGQIEIAADVHVKGRTSRPLTDLQDRSRTVWTVFGHPVVQLETVPRIRAEGLKVQLTTGAVTLPQRRHELAARPEVGAVIIEHSADGVGHCRHLLSPADGDGSFQDLTVRAQNGSVTKAHRVEALNFGDVHHSCLDEAVAKATWGIGGPDESGSSLVDSLRPRTQVFHDLVDFSARSPFDSRNHHRRFAQHLNGGGNVRVELDQAVAFLSAARRPWCSCLVVQSNHDMMLTRWLSEADFREDPENAIFFLECNLALHRRLAKGIGEEGFFESTLRKLSPDRLAGIRFLGVGESHKVVDVEVGIHGDRGPDGRRGGLQAFERLGIKATIGHVHRPTTRDRICSAGVCQTELAYAKGHLTAWAVGHVVTYFNGSRQHLLLHGGRFHA